MTSHISHSGFGEEVEVVVEVRWRWRWRWYKCRSQPIQLEERRAEANAQCYTGNDDVAACCWEHSP